MNIAYLDTNIYLDFLLDRTGRTGRNLGDCAAGIFTKAMRGEIKIAISDWNLKELGGRLEMNQLTALFTLIRGAIKVSTTKRDMEEAKRLSHENFPDALHAILARKAGADFLVTRNIQHFMPFSGIIEARLPEQVC